MTLWHQLLTGLVHRLLFLRVRLSGPDELLSRTLRGETFQLEVARRPATLTVGLAHRPPPAPNHGLLLVLPQHRSPGAISTRFMRFALDLVFLDAAGQIVGVAKDVEPGLFPGVEVPARAVTVLELPAGTASRIGLATGTQLPELARARLA